jgi:ferredoxin
VAADAGRTDDPRRTVGPYTISFTTPGESAVCRPEETVLSAILRSGATVVFGCRGGGCGLCKMRLLSGGVEHGRCSTAVLPEEEKREGSFLSCQARPLSDLTIQLTAANRYRRLRAWSHVGSGASFPSGT